jgi:hypothetical protein
MDLWVPVGIMQQSVHPDRWNNDSQSRFEDGNQTLHHLNLEDQLELLQQQELQQLLLQNQMDQETQPTSLTSDEDHCIPYQLNLDEQLELLQQQDLQQLFLQNHMHPLVAEPQLTSSAFDQQIYGGNLST